MYRNRVKNDREYLHHFQFTNEKIQKRKIQNNFPVSFYTHFSHLQEIKEQELKKVCCSLTYLFIYMQLLNMYPFLIGILKMCLK